MSNASWPLALVKHAHEFLEGREPKFAFQATGYVPGGAGVSSYIRMQPEWAEMPTIEPLHCVLPRGRTGCVQVLSRNRIQELRAPAMLPAAEAGAAGSAPAGGGNPALEPWRLPKGKRLPRRRCRLQASRQAQRKQPR